MLWMSTSIFDRIHLFLLLILSPIFFTSALSTDRSNTITNRNTMSASSRIAVVTGGNKGIGFHIAEQLATSGLFSNVILACRDETRGQNAVQQIRSGKQPLCDISFLPLTLGNDQSHKSFRSAVEERYGRVDVLVNNAAMAFKGSSTVPFREQCKPTLDVNIRGTIDFTEEMLPLVRKGDDARIVNVASMAGRLGQIKSRELRQKFTSDELTIPQLRQLVDKYESDVLDGTHAEKGWGNSNYGMSKLALIAATRVWAREEAANGVKINCCCPGYCDTDMTSNMGPRPPSEGAKNAVLPATVKDCGTGQFYQNLQVSEW